MRKREEKGMRKKSVEGEGKRKDRKVFIGNGEG